MHADLWRVVLATDAAAAVLAVVCLLLWLTERTPPFVPTLVLLAALPWCGVGVGEGLRWMADPVLALFFGGFVLGEACAAHGLDRLLVGTALRAARGRAPVLVGAVLAVTASLSMWMSNVAAAALVISAVRPALVQLPDPVRRGILVAIAVGANLGGMATPIGTGPNAVAIAALDPEPTFLAWMVLAAPITAVSLALGAGVVAARHHVFSAPPALAELPTEAGDGERPGLVAGLLALAAVAWLTEPLHGVGAPVVSLAAAAVLFGSGLVGRDRLARLDWSTLLLVAGGIGLGRLLEHAGWLDRAATALAGADAHPRVVLAGLLVLAAGLSSVMSNTATATLLVPLATALHPAPGTPILVAMACSFGMPFVVSTPPNNMVVGAGARSGDLLVPGLVVGGFGCALLAVTGPAVLSAFGY